MKIESAILMHEERMMQFPNVTGIGIGKNAETNVIKVFVTQKLPEHDEIIPKKLEGYSTVVEEIGIVTAQTSYSYKGDM